jgi:hypothetical protein
MHRSSRRRRSDRQRDTQDSRQTLLKTRNPAHPGGTPSGIAAAMGCPRSIRSPLEPRVSQLSNTKNNEERERDKRWRDKNVDVKSSILIVRLCVVQSAVTPNIYKRRLDFPYKQRIHLGFPYKKINSRPRVLVLVPLGFSPNLAQTSVLLLAWSVESAYDLRWRWSKYEFCAL